MIERDTIKHMFPGYRVFVYGREITDDVLSVTVNWSVGRNLSTCNITLSNERDKYLLSAADIVAMSVRELISHYPEDAAGRDIQPTDTIRLLSSHYIYQDIVELRTDAERATRATELEKFQEHIGKENIGVFSYPTAADLYEVAKQSEFSVLDKESIKHSVIHQKALEPTVTNFSEVFEDKKEEDTGEKGAYSFSEGSCIFDAMDPVRVFFREPDSDVVDRDTGGVPWYYGFTGWVSTISEGYGAKGMKTVSLSCEDVLKNLRHSVIIPNTALYEADVLEQLVGKVPGFQRGLFYLSSPIAGLNMEDSAEFTVFGGNITAKKPVVGKDGVIKEIPIEIEGVGTFDKNRRVTARYPTEPFETLEKWQNLVTNRVQLSDTQTMANSEFANATLSARTIDEVITEIGGDPFKAYPVEGTMWMLLPDEKNFTLDNTLLTEELNKFVGDHLRLIDRLSLLYAVVKRIEFELYAHPKGNIIIEFPLFDFFPTDFGQSYIRDLVILDGVVDKVDTVLSDQNLKTVYISTPVLGITEGANFPGVEGGLPRQAEVLQNLITKYGIRVEYGNMDSALTSTDAAKAYSKIALRKLNSNNYTTSVPTVFNPRMWLNRPFLYEARNHVGTVQKIVHNIVWNSQASTSVGLAYMRGWQGRMQSDGLPLYEAIGGRASQPLNYRKLFFVPPAKLVVE